MYTVLNVLTIMIIMLQQKNANILIKIVISLTFKITHAILVFMEHSLMKMDFVLLPQEIYFHGGVEIRNIKK